MSEGAVADMSGRTFRELCRRGEFDGPTAGVARGYVQANLVVVEEKSAAGFEAFCRANPGPCPVLSVLDPGAFEPRTLAPGADLRNDLPRYRVFRKGVCVDLPTSIEAVWRSDLVAFLLGCSFTFERFLLEAGLPVRHLEEGRNVPMYRTNIPCVPAGPFDGPLVVSMRPMSPRQAEEARRITASFGEAHGEPVHVGDPAAIGIADLSQPDHGDAVTIHPGEVPVFWACGVTPMEALMRAKLEFAITHEPGHMFVTDLRDSEQH